MFFKNEVKKKWERKKFWFELGRDAPQSVHVIITDGKKIEPIADDGCIFFFLSKMKFLFWP